MSIAAPVAISSEFVSICANQNLNKPISCKLRYKSRIKGNKNASKNKIPYHKKASVEANLPSSRFCINLDVSCVSKLYLLEVLLMCSNIIKIKTNIIKSSANMDAEYESPKSKHSLKNTNAKSLYAVI